LCIHHRWLKKSSHKQFLQKLHDAYHLSSSLLYTAMSSLPTIRYVTTMWRQKTKPPWIPDERHSTFARHKERETTKVGVPYFDEQNLIARKEKEMQNKSNVI
jgi:hypothetical protein